MRQTFTYRRAKLDIDDKLIAQLREAGFATSLAELSRACGKNSSYFACMRKRGYSLHVGSLAFLQARLSREMEEASDVLKRARLRTVVSVINAAIQEKCRLRELELLS